MLPEKAKPLRGEKGRFNGREPSAYYSFTQPNTDSSFPWTFLADRNDPDHYEINFPLHEGAAVWVRPDLGRATLAREMQAQGILTVGEVDDNYLSNPQLNLFMRSQGITPKAQLDHLKALASMSRIVFSTDWLLEIYRRAIKQQFRLTKTEMPGLVVCRNNIDAADWPAIIEHDGPTRVGWMGSPSHIWDVDLAWPALMHARNQGCETWMVGYDPTNPEGSTALPAELVRSPRSQEKIDQWAKVGYRHIPWQLPKSYHRMPLPFDIGLAPLLSNSHTFAKSDCKWIEYSIAGAATIAMNNVVYNRSIIHGETGLLVGSAQEMLDAVDLLIRKPALRESLVANAQQYVREERGGKQLREEWTAAVTP